MLLAVQIALIPMALVIMAWWYAPVLVCPAWDSGAGKALFFSLMAYLATGSRSRLRHLHHDLWRPVAGAGARPAGIGHSGSRQRGDDPVLPLPVFVLAPTLIASFYHVSYREVFSLADDEETRPLDA